MDYMEHLYMIYYLGSLLISLYLFFLIINSKGFPSVMHSFLRGIYIIFNLIFLFESVLLYGMLNLQEKPDLLITLFRFSLIPKYVLSLYLIKFGLSLASEFRYERRTNIFFLTAVAAIVLFHGFQPLATSNPPLRTDFQKAGYLIVIVAMATELSGGLLIFLQRKQFEYFRKIIARMGAVGLAFWLFELFELTSLLRGNRSIRLYFDKDILSHFMHVASPLFFLSLSYFIYRIFARRKERILPEFKIDAYQRLFALTEREREVLSRILSGLTNDEIQDELCIAKSTLKSHINRIFSKCRVSSRLELIYLFLETDEISRKILTLEN